METREEIGEARRTEDRGELTRELIRAARKRRVLTRKKRRRRRQQGPSSVEKLGEWGQRRRLGLYGATRST
jgi:hypothetical protein